MATIVAWNGSNFSVPATGEENWGGTNKVDGLLISLALNGLQKSGGLFTLSADLDFGPTAGLKSLYYKSRTANVATAGQIRLAKTDVVSFRNNANSANLDFGINSLDQPTFNGSVIGGDDPSVVDVLSYGALGDGSTDDTTAIGLAITAATALVNAGKTATLLFPSGFIAFKITSAITVGVGTNVIMDSPVKYVGSSEITAVTIGASATSNYGLYLKLNVTRNTQADWTNEANVGVKVHNLNYSTVVITNIEKFTINYLAQATGGRGYAYNKHWLGNVYNGKVQVDLNATTAGFPNENQFYGGNFGTSANQTLIRYGIRIRSSDSSYNPNNNTFYNPSLQLGDVRVTGNCSTSVTPTLITGMSSTTGIAANDLVVSSYFPAGTTVISVDSVSQVTVSQSATSNGAPGTHQFVKSYGFRTDCGIGNQVYGARTESCSISSWTSATASGNDFVSSYSNYWVTAIDTGAGASYFTLSGIYPLNAVGTFGSSPAAAGLSISGHTLTMQPADSTHPGGISLSAQTMGTGVKTFPSPIVLSVGSASNPSVSIGEVPTGFLFSSGGSGHLLEWTINGTLGGAFDTNALQFNTTTSTASYDVIRSVGTGSTRIMGGTGSSAGMIQVYGATHATKPAWMELSANGGVVLTFNATGVATMATALSVSDSTASTTTSTGSGIFAGGVGVAGQVTAGGALKTTSSTAASSTSTGCIIGAGGLGLAGAAYIGGIISAAAGSTANPEYTFTGDPDSGFANQSANSVDVICGGVITHRWEQNGVQCNMTSTTSHFDIYRSVNTGVLRLQGGTGSASAYVDLYGSTHATKASLMEFSNTNGINGVIDAAGLWTIGKASTTQQHALNVATAAANAGALTLLNGPTGKSGNPTGYIQITINGSTAVIPYW